MADFVSPSDGPPFMTSASFSAGASAVADDDDTVEDACSICLEPFNAQDPPTVTNCKHEYHLQCILEWSQRSKECPICWQNLVLNDPTSQELLAAVETERSLRSRHNVSQIHEDYETDQDAPYVDDSDFDERIMLHLAAAASRARNDIRRRTQWSSGIGPSQVRPSVPTAEVPSVQEVYTSPEECPNSSHLLEVDSLTSNSSFTIIGQTPALVPPVVNVVPNTVDNNDGSMKPRVPYSQPPPDGPRRSTSSDLLAFSESFKSRLSAASARYKDSISKSTRGLKEKLVARNNSVKELSRGVQREMSAGIAGVARMIERLDLTSKRTGDSVPLSSCTGETSDFSNKGKDVQENVIVQSFNGNAGESAHDIRSDALQHISNTISSRTEASVAQSGN